MAPHPILSDAFIASVKRVVAETAAFIRQERLHFSDDKVEHKRYNDLVSYVDRAAEEMLVRGLGALLPGSGFIGEEGGEHHAQAEWRWIIDPLDGTTNFIHDLPFYCISVALQHDGQTLLGIVHDVPHGEVFWSVKGGGAWLGDKPIHVSSHEHIGAAIIGTGFPHVKKDLMGDYLAVIQDLLQCSHGIRRLGAAALDLAFVACGRLDGFFELGLSPWDVAAGALLVEEAGGRVTDFQGGSNYLFGRQIVATNHTLGPALLEVLAKNLVL